MKQEVWFLFHVFKPKGFIMNITERKLYGKVRRGYPRKHYSDDVRIMMGARWYDAVKSMALVRNSWLQRKVWPLNK